MSQNSKTPTSSKFQQEMADTSFDHYIADQKDKGLSMIGIIAIILASFIAWATSFEIDTTVRATGKVIPSARTQVVQAADGGVLSQLFVKEGDDVRDGQLLAVLEKERANAKYQEESARVTALEVALIRAKAETRGVRPDFVRFQETNPIVVKAQQEYYQQRKDYLYQEQKMLNSSLKMAQTELEMNENLQVTGDASNIEVMRAQRQVNDVHSNLMEAKNKYLDEAHREVTRIEAELKSLRFKLGAANNVLNHTEIRSPVTGVIKFLGMNTLGGVLRLGDELMQISPSKGGLIVEANVAPVDIGKLKTDMPVFVKLDAFDYTIYGNLQGTLDYISSDTLTEKDSSGRESVYYSVQVTIDEEHMKNQPKWASIKLKPGMNVTIDIKTGSKTVFNYLSKPITRAFSGALH